ncbi:MAG: protein-L-isoaspartate(D-aspartate) O-methyltransferase [Planctomycetes bacterium]|nr:protein-L-isoaspartate(D-aspartate) O-methyltransferase [Planctomycetota bacterium]
MTADAHEEFTAQRQRMVARDVVSRGVRSQPVIDALKRVRRERYVPEHLREHAYTDAPLAIGDGQTISQPYIVAYMIEALALAPGARVLEIGTGSGYAAAVLAEIAAEVYTIERHPGLADSAAKRLAKDGHLNVHVRHGDGTLGWPEAAPFDAIVVAACGAEIPRALEQQLAVGGRLVMPVGEQAGEQELVRVTRIDEQEFRCERLCGVRFVPLIESEAAPREP